MESFIEATNAAVGTAVSKIATYPLDIVKTRLATAEGRTSVSSVVADLTREKGLAGLFFGVENKLAKSCTAKFIYFYIYRALLNAVASGAGEVSVASNLVIGYLGEFLSLPVVMPLEAVVSKSQTSGLTGREAAAQMYREGGLGRFYVAPFAYVVGCCQPAIQYTLFDQVKALYFRGSKIRELSAFQAFVLGAVSNAIAATMCYPLEVVRMTQQSGGQNEADGDEEGGSDGTGVGVEVAGGGGESKNGSHVPFERVKKSEAGPLAAMARHALEALKVLKMVVKQDGVAGLFKGLGPQLLASVLSSALMMMVKERILNISSRILYLLLTGGKPPSKQVN